MSQLPAKMGMGGRSQQTELRGQRAQEKGHWERESGSPGGGQIQAAHSAAPPPTKAGCLHGPESLGLAGTAPPEGGIEVERPLPS